MRYRTGFVSNSSSSSFLLATRTPDRLSDQIYDALAPGLARESLMGRLAEEATACLINGSRLQSLHDIIKRWEESDDLDKWCKLYAEGWHIYLGYAADDEGAIERLICDTDINITTPDLIIEHSGGY